MSPFNLGPVQINSIF